jgi:hypothetical protein
MPTGPQVILILKIAVISTTILLAASIVALAKKRPRLHGQLNVWVAILLLSAVILFEGVIRLLGVDVTEHMNAQAQLILKIHLFFVIPLIPFLILMLMSGLGRRIKIHLQFTAVFLILWLGMLITGMMLPHS